MPALLGAAPLEADGPAAHRCQNNAQSRYSSSWIENQLMLQSRFCCAIHFGHFNCSARAEPASLRLLLLGQVAAHVPFPQTSGPAAS